MGSFGRGIFCLVVGWGLVLSQGCSAPADNQLIIESAVDRQLADPVPIGENHRARQSRHRVLLGVVDSGIDYNHPALVENVHYELDRDGTPTGLGKDLVGGDDWASHRIIRTSTFDPRLDQKGRDKSVLGENRTQELLDANPALGKWFHPRRNLYQELKAGVYHGTHVAALMVYDRPDFGLIPYRVLPNNITDPNGFDVGRNFDKRFREAIEQAHRDGVRIVNISLSVTFSNERVSHNERLRSKIESYRRVALEFSQILFVAAAGNDGKWTDGRVRHELPCGIEVPNLICVGGLDQKGEFLWSGTNIVLSRVPMFFARAEKVLSAYPTDMCHSWKAQRLIRRLDLKTFPELTQEDLAGVVQACEDQGLYVEFSGTSMATPLVSRFAGTVLAGLLARGENTSPVEIIKAMKSEATIEDYGNYKLYVVPNERPSWHPVRVPENKRVMGWLGPSLIDRAGAFVESGLFFALGMPSSRNGLGPMILRRDEVGNGSPKVPVGPDQGKLYGEDEDPQDPPDPQDTSTKPLERILDELYG